MEQGASGQGAEPAPGGRMNQPKESFLATLGWAILLAAIVVLCASAESIVEMIL